MLKKVRWLIISFELIWNNRPKIFLACHTQLCVASIGGGFIFNSINKGAALISKSLNSL